MNNTVTETDSIVKRIEDLIKKELKLNNAKLTPYRIAKSGKLDTSTLNKILDKTNKDIRLSTVGKICKGFNMSLRDFFDDDIFD